MYRHFIQKATPGDDYRIWHQCDMYLHQSASSTESSRGIQNEVAQLLIILIFLSQKINPPTILNHLTKRNRLNETLGNCVVLIFPIFKVSM